MMKIFKKSRYFPDHKLVTILPNFPIILNGLRLPGSGTFTFPPATRFNKSKEKQIESFRRHQLKNPSFLCYVNVLGPSFLFKSFENNCFWKTAFNKPNQSVIIGIIYKWLANNCLIMKWPDFTTTTAHCSFQSEPLFREKHPVSRVLFLFVKEFYRYLFSHWSVSLPSFYIISVMLNTCCNIIQDIQYKCK